MKFSPRVIGYSTGLMAAFFWGIHSVVIRYLTQQDIQPNLIAGLRLYIGVITLFLILQIKRFFWGSRRKDREKIVYNAYFWLAAVCLGIEFLFFQAGLKYTLASDANLIQNFSPVAVLIISSLLLRHRIKEIAPTSRYWMNVFQIILVGSIGASLVLINDVNNSIVPSHEKLFGDLLEFLGMIFFSFFVMFNSEYTNAHTRISSTRVTMMMLTVAALVVSVFVPFGDMAMLSGEQWIFIIFIGVFSTGVAYWLWDIASRHLNVVPLALNLVYIGIITVLTEVLFLDLTLDWKIVVGATMMITASVMAEIINVRAKKFHHTGS